MRADVSCACAPCACCHEPACALTSRVRASYLSQEHEHFGPLVHSRPGMAIPTLNHDIVWTFACQTSVSNYATSVFEGV